jgi:tRNA modification GTPase
LREVLAQAAFEAPPSSEERMVLNQRHRALLEEVRGTLAHTLERVERAGALAQQPELFAADLRHVLDGLGQVIGSGGTTPDDILGRIFASFCIGK